jgi:hypothetical protein
MFMRGLRLLLLRIRNWSEILKRSYVRLLHQVGYGMTIPGTWGRLR